MKWSGLDELKKALRNLPADLTHDARPIVLDSAQGAADTIRDAYPVGETGNLRAGVEVQVSEPSQFGVAAKVRNKAKHANMYEHGTQIRKNKAGANRGAAPPHPTFVPNVIRARKRMYEQLKDMLEREGLEVKGDA